MGEPILFLQWLCPGEYRETHDIIQEFQGNQDPNIKLVDAQNKSDVMNAIASWLQNDNAQFLYIGAHGVKDEPFPYGPCLGFGPGGCSDEFVSWAELWNLLVQGVIFHNLWLGFCSSAEAEHAWSPLPDSIRCKTQYIAGFTEDISAGEVRDALRELTRNTTIDGIVLNDEEIQKICAVIPATKLTAHKLCCPSGDYPWQEID